MDSSPGGNGSRLAQNDSRDPVRTYTGRDESKFKIQNSKIENQHSSGDYALTLRLPVPMLDVKVFLKLLQLELHARPPAAPVEKVFVSTEPILPRFTQGGLFLPTAPEPEKLEVMLSRLKAVVSNAPSDTAESPDLRVGSAELLDTFRPDAFRMKPFAPKVASCQLPVAGKLASRAGNSSTALRRFRPPMPIRVEVCERRPISIFDFRFTIPSQTAGPSKLEQIKIQKSKIENVFWSAGPWIESGDWWTDAPWSREVWDVAVKQEDGVAIYRIYRDMQLDRWFLEATYD